MFIEHEKGAARVQARAHAPRMGGPVDPMTLVGSPDFRASGATSTVLYRAMHACGEPENRPADFEYSLAGRANFLDSVGGGVAGGNDAAVRFDKARPAGPDGRQVIVFAQVREVDAQSQHGLEQGSASVDLAPVDDHRNTSGQNSSADLTGPVAI
nr:hypothetical protein [Tepidiforma sp.]